MVQYVQVNPRSDLFSPAVRAFGNIAIIGDATAGPTNTPTLFANPGDAKTLFPGTLSDSIALAFQQSPGPTVIYGVRPGAGPDWAGALTSISTLNVQFVVLAHTALDKTTGAVAAGATPAGPILQLAQHVMTVSNTGGDGKERMGVAMLAKGSADPTIVAGELASFRMIYIAHKSDQDAAAAVAGTIAGYPPYISMVLKPVSITTDLFIPSEIATINGVEGFGDPPGGQKPLGVNWFTSPAILPGSGIYLGEGYTGDPGTGKKFIDITRTIDDVSFRLKANLIQSIGTLRISRSGLRSLTGQMEAVLDPLVRDGVIEDYQIQMPTLILLDKDPTSLTDSELKQIHLAQANRVVDVFVSVTYAGAIHRLALTLTFV